MKKSFLFIALSICFIPAYTQKQSPVLKYRHDVGPLKAIIHTNTFPANASSFQQPYDSLVQYKFNSAIDSVHHSKSIYTYDNESRRIDELMLRWDIENHAWKNYIKIQYAYDEADRLTLESDYWYTEGNWVGFFKEEKAFDAIGNQVLYIYSMDWNSTLNEFIPMEKSETTYEGERISTSTSFDWMQDSIGGDWVPNSQTKITYNENGAWILNIRTRWSAENNHWISDSKDTAIYNNQGQQTRSETYFWVSDSWQPYQKYLLEYNGLSFITASYEYVSATDSWLPNHKAEHTKDVNGNILSSIDYIYNSEFSDWILSSKSEYTYDEDQNKTSQIIALWNDYVNAWDMQTKWVKTFDDQNRVIFSAQFEWDIDITDWKEIWKNEKTFDDFGNLAEEVNVNYKNATGYRVLYNFDNNGNTISYIQYNGDYDNWILSYKGYYYLTPQIPSDASASEATSILIYPNPTANVIRISGFIGLAYLTLYDMQGNPVIQRTVESGHLISMDGLLRGIYILKVKTNERTLQRKIVKAE